MTAQSKSGFVLPFTLGTAFGVISGVTLGALLGHRLFTAHARPVVLLWARQRSGAAVRPAAPVAARQPHRLFFWRRWIALLEAFDHLFRIGAALQIR